MRQVIIEIELNERARAAHRAMFEFIESYEVLEVLRIDYGEGIYIDLIECRVKPGVSIEDLTAIDTMDILSVLQSDGDTHTCLIKGRDPDQPHAGPSLTELDLIWTTPSFISEDRIIVSCIGSHEDLRFFIGAIRDHIGTIVDLSFKKAAYQKGDVLSALTDKQREILVAAYTHGYYDLPKRISSVRLAELVNISKPTLLEHLRKAERRILDEIMVGQLP